MAEERIIDRVVLDQRLSSVDGDLAFLGDLIDTYLADARDLLTQMQGSLAAGDVDRFRRAAHSLKSNSANLGAMGLAQEAGELEYLARGGSLAGADAKVAGIADTYAAVSTELSRLRA